MGLVLISAPANATWAIATTLLSSNAEPFGFFGESVASRNGLVVTGAPGETVNGYAQAGRAYVFNATSGALLYTLSSPNIRPFEAGAFGASVAIGNGLILVGAPRENIGYNFFAGRVYVFNATTGSPVFTLSANIEGGFGWSVALDNGRIVVGAPATVVGGLFWGGEVYVYNATTGSPIMTIVSPISGSRSGGSFGYSVAIGKGLLIVGAPGETVSGMPDAGRVYVFNTEKFSLVGTLESPNVLEGGFPSCCDGGRFGRHVALTEKHVIVAAPLEAVNRLDGAGRVYIFNIKKFSLARTVASPNNIRGLGEFGESVVGGNGLLIVGAPSETPELGASGRVYIFSEWGGYLIRTLVSPNQSTLGQFGNAVAVAKGAIIVGARAEAGGRVYVFKIWEQSRDTEESE